MISGTPYFYRYTAEESDAQVKLRRFANFSDGWNYGEGRSFSKERLNEAQEIAQLFVQVGISSNDAFPGLADQIMITGYTKNGYLEYTTVGPDAASFRAESNGVVITDTGVVSKKEALASFVDVVAGGSWNTSGSSMSGNTLIGVAIGSTHSLFPVLQTGALPSSSVNASTGAGGAVGAGTSAGSIPKTHSVNLMYSGNLIAPFYLPDTK